MASTITGNKSTREELMVSVIVADNCLKELQKQWQHQDEGALLLLALSFLDVKNLLQSESVNKRWRKLCQGTINAKCGQDGLKAFQSKKELRFAANVAIVDIESWLQRSKWFDVLDVVVEKVTDVVFVRFE
jgi:hypothetical protein